MLPPRQVGAGARERPEPREQASHDLKRGRVAAVPPIAPYQGGKRNFAGALVEAIDSHDAFRPKLSQSGLNEARPDMTLVQKRHNCGEYHSNEASDQQENISQR